MKEAIYVLSLSFGKDSMAMLHEIVTKGLPLNYVIHCDIMFDSNTSGEHPLMAEWIPYAEKRIKELYGVDITHLTAKKNFTEQFYTIKQKGNRIGRRYGYPYTIGAWCNSRLKLDPISKFIKDLIGGGIRWLNILALQVMNLKD